MADTLSVVIVGAGLAGANAALEVGRRAPDAHVTLIGREAHLPYQRPPLSKGFLRGSEPFEDAFVAPREAYERLGIELLLGRTAVKLEPDAKRIRLDGDEVISYDRALFATGGRKRHLRFPGAEREGVVDLRTVEVDEYCRTSIPDVYAAGDIADHAHPLFGRLRVEHYNNAEKQGRSAAASLLDQGVPYDYVHSFWSDQYDQTLEYVGFAATWETTTVEGSLSDRDFIVRYFRRGKLLAAAAMGRGGDPASEEPGELKDIANQIHGAGGPEV